MIGHDAVGENATPGKTLDHAHQETEVLFFIVLKEELSMDHSGSDVVAGKVRKSSIRVVRNDQSGGRHGGSLEEREH